MGFLVFFPAVALLYFVFPKKYRWIWLLVASYYFYMSWNVQYALLIAMSTMITYLSGLLIARSNAITDKRKRDFHRKLWVALSFISNLAILCFFKYFDFVLDNLNRILSYAGVQAIPPTFDIILPVGISFYTFQALGYTVDVYREKIAVEKNPARYALYVSFFPQLVAGPIERSDNLLRQVHEEHRFSYANLRAGLFTALVGYFKKVCIADRAAALVNQVFSNYQQYAGFEIVVAVAFFAIQIYCDFSGYSDIAIGTAKVLGFDLVKNFKQPYFAASIQEFWRRWHMSLSTWFRDYLYIPLGGSRCSKAKKYRNVMITFLCSGLWHGANWTFVAWGGLHGFYHIVGEATASTRARLTHTLKIPRPIVYAWRIFFTFILVCFSWIFFRADNLLSFPLFCTNNPQCLPESLGK
jgi:D-alanyl-lipoteichoic acid acyltransferase DltB (MBOAT superfamily)